MSMNKVLAIGNLGRDAELKYNADGRAMSTFSVATSYGSGEKAQTEWLNCVWFGDRAEAVAQYMTKGKQVYVEGRLQTRNWQDDSGQKHYRTEIVVGAVQLLGQKTGEGNRYDD